MADTRLEEVLVDGVPHQAVVDGGAGDAFEQIDGLVVVAFEGGQIGDLEEILVGEPATAR